MYADYAQFIEEMKDIAADSLLNPGQKARFVESTIQSFMLRLELDDLPAIQAAIRVAAPHSEGPRQ